MMVDVEVSVLDVVGLSSNESTFQVGNHTIHVAPEDHAHISAILWSTITTLTVAVVASFWANSTRCKTGTASHRVAMLTSLAAGWYTTSNSLILVNKALFATHSFEFPLIMTVVHMWIKYGMAVLVVRGRSRFTYQHPPRVSKRIFWRYIAPIGLTTVLDIALSNVALQYVTITLYTVVKSSSLVFNAVFSVWLGLIPASFVIIAPIVGVSVGVGMASFSDTSFGAFGFTLTLTAALLGAIRWVLTHYMMAGSTAHGKLESLDLLYLFAPVSAISIVPIAIALEGYGFVTSGLWSSAGTTTVVGIIIILGGMSAFALLFLEMAIINISSAVTLNTLGHIRTILLILLAAIVFGDHMSLLRVIGVTMVITGAVMYGRAKRREPGDGDWRDDLRDMLCCCVGRGARGYDRVDGSEEITLEEIERIFDEEVGGGGPDDRGDESHRDDEGDDESVLSLLDDLDAAPPRPSPRDRSRTSDIKASPVHPV